jgi:glyoxylase-like metal-dependent hydrolase (beta-lactamase superfamily II)
MNRHLPILLLIVAAACSSAAAQDFDAVEIKTEKLSDGVYMLVGRGGNIGLSAGEDTVFMIDDQYAPLTEKIKAAVAAISDMPIQFILNTHYHGDHVGGNEALGEAGSVIVAHENVRARLSTEQFMEFHKRKVPPYSKAALPVITFTRDVTFHLNGDDIRVFHVEHAHTDGDAIIHFEKANVIHMGDVYFEGMYPFIDLSAGGSIDGVIAAVERVLGMANDKTKIIPGHGPLSDRAGLTAYHDMLTSIRNRIAALITEGKSLDEIVASEPSKEFDEVWGQGFIKPADLAEFIYTSLAGSSK